MTAIRNLISKIIVLVLVTFGIYVVAFQAQTEPPHKVVRTYCEYQGREVPCPTGGGSGGGTTTSGSGGGAVGWLLCKTIGGFGCPKKTDTRKQDAYDLNQKGVEAFNNGELAVALSYFEQALKKDPSDPVIKQNIQNARDAMAAKAAKEKSDRENEQAKLRDKAAADNMQKSIQDFAKTLSAAPTSGGLDFDGGLSSATPMSGSSGNGLDFTTGDTNVVAAPRAPFGISKDMDDAISGAFKNSPPGVMDRVRRGFQAVMNRDWKAAKAWFQDALKRDPSNASLQALIKLTDYDKKAPQVQLPADSDLELLFRPGPVYPPLPPIYMVGRDGKPIRLPDDYQGEVRFYEMKKDGSLVPLPRLSDYRAEFMLQPKTPERALSAVPTYRIDTAGNPVEVPDDYDGKETLYIKGKDGKLMMVPKPSDLMFLDTPSGGSNPPTSPKP